MGCAASADGEREPTIHAGTVVKAPTTNGKPTYRRQEDGPEAPPHLPNSSSSRLDQSHGNLLTQSILSDLRLKSSKEGPGINRWVDGILLPCEEDNEDLYDPLRRHKLAMESITIRQQKPTTTSSTTIVQKAKPKGPTQPASPEPSTTETEHSARGQQAAAAGVNGTGAPSQTPRGSNEGCRNSPRSNEGEGGAET